MPKPKTYSVEELRELHSYIQRGEFNTLAALYRHLSADWPTLTPKVLSSMNRGVEYSLPDEYQYPLNQKYIKQFPATMVCSVDGCDHQAQSIWKGDYLPYCSKHYMNLWRYGEIKQGPTMFDENPVIRHETYDEIVLMTKDGIPRGTTIIDKGVVDELVPAYKWYLTASRGVRPYCQCSLKSGIKMRLHRLLLERVQTLTPGLQVDHINGDPLDNRLANLREVTSQENSWNIRPDKQLGVHKLVYASTKKVKYKAEIFVHGKSIWLGSFQTEEEAIAARKAAEVKYFNRPTEVLPVLPHTYEWDASKPPPESK